MHVVLVEPCFPANQKEFVRALHQAGATVTGVGERPKEALDDDLRRWLVHYEQVPTVVDAVPSITGSTPSHRVPSPIPWPLRIGTKRSP